MKTAISIAMTGLIVLAHAAWAANPPASLVMIPAQINYQGRLVTTTNSPYADAVHTIDLTLYPTASGGDKLWSERYAVQTRDGYFSVNLGSSGAGLLPTNKEIWQVMWRTNGSPDTFFMAMTVRTAPNGSALTSPVEATPRQQFVTAPFAYRAHQSLYASKADTLFDAPEGIQSPMYSSTNLLSIESRNTMSLISYNGMAILSSNLMMAGSVSNALGLFGKWINLGTSATTTNILVNSKPMFVMTSKTASTTSGNDTYNISHGFSTADYDVMVVGFSSIYGVRAAIMSPTLSFCTIQLSSVPTTASQITVRFLGIRKGLIHHQ